MAISLSELTGASTSGNVLNEVNSYADFLDSVPRLVNKADPTGATDAVQTVATKQPIALPLDANGKGYLFQPNVLGNAPAVEFPTIGANDDFVLEMVAHVENPESFYIATGADITSRLAVHDNTLYSKTSTALTSALVAGPCTLRVERASGTITLKQDGVIKVSGTESGAYDFTYLSFNGQFGTGIAPLNGYIQTATLSINGTEELNIDFTSPRIPHGATEFECETGQVVTVNTSGNNPSKVIKKPVLRFDGSDDGFKGLLNQTTVTDGCYLFAAFSVLGDGGEQWGRVISFNPTGGEDYQNGGHTFILKSDTTSNLSLPTGTETGMFDDANGDILVESGKATNYQKSRVNDASVKSQVGSNTILFDEFNLGASWNGSSSTSIDLEYLAVFPATLTDSQADQIRNYINNRNKVFYRWDTDGYYFFDGAATTDGQVFSGSGSWNGRIVGSDNGDSDFYISQNTLDDRPTTDGYKITFADNTDHFDTPQITLAAGDSYAWMICGTSLGTFAYKVTVTGQTELNLLGHLGWSTTRQTGDLYGIILLPENATNREIEEARKLLIDRGAADASTITNTNAAWYHRYDIIEFKNADFPTATSLIWAFEDARNLRTINTVNAPISTDFTKAWYNCENLTSFPADSKLGTEASNVDFESAWRESGLTSFSTPLPTATNLFRAWQSCNSLTSFNTELPSALSVATAWYNCSSLTSFSASLPLVTNAQYTWAYCYSLENFSTSLPLVTRVDNAWTYCSSLESFSTPLPSATTARFAWNNCSSLTDFSADVFSNWNPSSITDGVFNQTWTGCSALSAQSVENILVGISNSGKWATTSGLEGGTALTDATIDIDYDTNTGSLTAATLTAIETLNGRGWSVNINGVIQ